MEYKWTVNKVKVAENNLIVKVDLTVIGTDENDLAAAAYSRDLTRSSSFIEYEKLTEQQVLDWCFAPQTTTSTDIDGSVKTVTHLLKDEGEAQVAGQIARQLIQKQSELALPWVEILKGEK